MKSFCIKTNNSEIIHYLLEKFANFDMESVYFSENKFRIYHNIILHYLGTNEEEFLCRLSDYLTDCILHFYEEKILCHLLRYNYFYFDEEEQKHILSLINTILSEEETYQTRDSLIWPELLHYLSENHSFVLSGFVSFRLKEYIKQLDLLVDEAVHKFIIEREYSEFIQLLKMYITSQPPSTSFLHLVYVNGESLLFDEKHKPISLNNHTIQAKYLSDITFSSNDYALNTLLNLLPSQLEVHLIDSEDEFIHTLEAIFEDRIHLCRDCSICTTYKRFRPVPI